MSDIRDIPEEYQDIYTRISDRLLGGGILSNISGWLEKNTKLAGDPFSFKDHEFQIDIANDLSANGVIKKCAQVGLSELSIRVMLGILAISNSRRAIYVLPSAAFAAEFTKARIDPVIEDSPRLKGLLISAANSSKMKRIGNSIMYVGGAATQKQAISRPADTLFIDEEDHCNQMVLSSYASRMLHAGDRYYRRSFSTPTVGGFGVDEAYSMSSQKRYQVQCEHCNEWQAPDFLEQVVIPGFKEPFDQFEKDDLLNPAYLVKDSYIRCIKCGKPLDASMAQVERRQWVADYFDRAVAGWAVKPYDLIKYNPTHQVVARLRDYSRLQDYYNFVLGETKDSEDNSFSETRFREKTILKHQEEADGCVMGIDVGKTCYWMVAKPAHGQRKRRIIAYGRTKQPNQQQLEDIYHRYGCYRGVIDAGPDFTLVHNLRQKLGDNFRPATYVKGNPKDKGFVKHAEDDNALLISRTRAFDVMVTEVNSGMWEFSDSEDKDLLYTQSQGLKRVDKIDEEGQSKARWEKIERVPDHYLHAMMYVRAALELDEEDIAEEEVASPPLIGGATVGSKAPTPRETDETASYLASLFGLR